MRSHRAPGSISMVNAKNLPHTCGKCHPGAGTRFAIGPVHLVEGSSKEPPTMRYVRMFYLVVIPGTNKLEKVDTPSGGGSSIRIGMNGLESPAMTMAVIIAAISRTRFSRRV